MTLVISDQKSNMYFGGMVNHKHRRDFCRFYMFDSDFADVGHNDGKIRFWGLVINRYSCLFKNPISLSWT